MRNAQSTTRRNGSNHRHSANGHRSIRLSQSNSDQPPVLITGGAGFIGTNLAHRLLASGRSVILYDNLSRPGVEHNLSWLQATHPVGLSFVYGDILDAPRLRRVVARASQVFHFAAQVAVTTSLDDPIHDFEINARGTLNLLEALRSLENPPSLLYTSTNKVYGDLNDVKLRNSNERYEPEESEVRQHGFDEQRPLKFHSPYGCSKGAACQYVLDYARTFGLRTAVFRMSCIYGHHQFGNEDQGWVAHFLIKALKSSPITIYGDGRQVRDVLFVEDLVDAMLLAQENINSLAGEVFNIGGGSANTISLLELLNLISELQGHRPDVQFADWRPADQQYYVSDIRKFCTATGWCPRIPVRSGVSKLYHWLQEFHRAEPSRILNLRDAVARQNGGANGNTPAGSKTFRGRQAIQLKAFRGHERPKRVKRVERKLAKAG